MSVRTRPRAAATGLAIAGIAAVAATPLTPVPQSPSSPAVSRDVRLVATDVPPGGLLTSILGNQLVYCSAICGPLINTGVTAAVTTLQTPVSFAAAVQSGDILKAIGITAASVTGPTNTALAQAIDADATVAVPKTSNAFEVGVIGLLNIVPAAAGGLPAVGDAIAAARSKTFEALNLPIPVTASTVMPNGVVQVATLGAIRVGEAIIFPAFNDVLQATVGVPNAAAQELAATGDPVRAAAAGARSAIGSVSAAANVVTGSVVTAAASIRTAAGQPPLGNVTTSTQKAPTTRTIERPTRVTSSKVGASPRHPNAEPGSHPVHHVASTAQQAVRSVIKHASANSPDSVSDRQRR